MWQQIPGAYKGVEAWHDLRDQQRLARAKQYLRLVRAALKSTHDSEMNRRACIRKTAALAIRNRCVREYLERDLLTGQRWRTFTPDELVEYIWFSVAYACWHPEEYLSIANPWPEHREQYVH